MAQKTMNDFTYDMGKQWTRISDETYLAKCGCTVKETEHGAQVFPCTLHVSYWANEI